MHRPHNAPFDTITAKTTHEMGHFMGQRWPAGTTVYVRPYVADDTYWEMFTPDGYTLTVADNDLDFTDTNTLGDWQ